MSLAIDLGYCIGGLAYLPVLASQAVRQGKRRGGWGERFGKVRSLRRHPRRIWIHAVSVGEMNATPLLVEQLSERAPDAEIVLSATTDTGMARGRALYPNRCLFRYPLDFSWVVRRVLRRIRPAMIVLVELEVWYHLVTLADRAGIALAVVNGRLSERSVRRFRLIAPLARRMFSRLGLVAAQDETYASRFAEFGVRPERLLVTGSLKWDTATVTERIDGQDALADALGLDTTRPTCVCGSTGPGEENMILEAYRCARSQLPELQLVIVPRKPERFDEVAAFVARAGFNCVRRSAHRDGGRRRPSPADVWLIDTMGELRKAYALASLVFVGRTLVPMGGSDPMEAAALGRPILVGPHTQNFHHAVRALQNAGALEVVRDAAELPVRLNALLQNRALLARMGRAGRDAVLRNQGATSRTVDALCRLLAGR